MQANPTSRRLEVWSRWTSRGHAVDTAHGPGAITETRRAAVLIRGAMVICDPHLMRGAAALDGEVVQGKWAIEGFVVKGQPPLGRRVGLVMGWPAAGQNMPPLAKVARWEAATIGGAPARVRVDYATGCVCSLGTTEKVAKSDAAYERVRRGVEMIDTPVNPKISGVPMVAFATGMGDGAYPVLWGLGEDGARRMVAVDFQLIEPSPFSLPA